PSAAPRTPATATARPASRRWTCSRSGRASTSTTAVRCNGPRSTRGSRLLIGCVREIKDNEYRVGLVPGGVKALVDNRHQVVVQAGAGLGSGIADEEYEGAGAEIGATAAEATSPRCQIGRASWRERGRGPGG